jgi:hypothetical protein
MPKFYVTRTSHIVYEVEAENSDEACEIVMEDEDNQLIVNSYGELNVEEI